MSPGRASLRTAILGDEEPLKDYRDGEGKNSLLNWFINLPPRTPTTWYFSNLEIRIT